MIEGDWPYNKIKKHFDASNHMISVAKNLAVERGILSMQEAKSGKILDTSIVKKVIDQYTNDDISRVMAGKKNFVSV